MNISEKKLLNIFRTFIEKVFVPQLPKMEPSCQKEWTKFSSMFSSDQFNYGEMQLYVDTLPSLTSSASLQTQEKLRNKSPFFAKTRKDSPANEPGGFNPSKTFGG